MLYDDAALADDFDHRRFAEEEFGTPIKPRGLSTFWWVTAIVVILAVGFILIFCGGFWTI